VKDLQRKLDKLMADGAGEEEWDVKNTVSALNVLFFACVDPMCP